ncbi:hypothetical protein HN011_003075 [Eciton burchellii]|nr:hypothetical protein HN011_003075 [Eciton burchellii]
MLLKLRIFYVISNFIYLTLRRILLLIHKKPSKIPAPSNNSLFTLSGTILARKIRQREITCYHLVSAYIERMKEVNVRINAVVGNRFSEAITEAKICDEQLKAGKFDIETLEREKPLFGLPFSVKETCALKDCSYTGGSLGRKEIKATRDCEAVEILRNAGAIPVCVTNTPEMCCGIESSNLLFGRSYTPYDTRYTSGGSSGGEGALVGSGASLIGLGTDLGCSIRLPAFWNGVFGLKATAGVVPSTGHALWIENEHFKKYFCMGPLTRYADDLTLIMKVLTAKCDRPLHLDTPVDLKKLKVYYHEGLKNSLGILPLEPEIKECISKTVKHFAQYGNHTEEFELPNDMIENTFAVFLKMKSMPFLININDPKVLDNPMTEFYKALFRRTTHTLQAIIVAILFDTQLFSESDEARYTKQAEEIRDKLANLLGKDGILICPTSRGTGLFPMLTLCEFPYCLTYSGVFNYFGFPALNVPMGLDHKGMPLGLQVIAAPYQERLCLAVAKELETTFGGWVPPYPVSD